jgi:hypothetical protein
MQKIVESITSNKADKSKTSVADTKQTSDQQAAIKQEAISQEDVEQTTKHLQEIKQSFYEHFEKSGITFSKEQTQQIKEKVGDNAYIGKVIAQHIQQQIMPNLATGLLNNPGESKNIPDALQKALGPTIPTHQREANEFFKKSRRCAGY